MAWWTERLYIIFAVPTPICQWHLVVVLHRLQDLVTQGAPMILAGKDAILNGLGDVTTMLAKSHAEIFPKGCMGLSVVLEWHCLDATGNVVQSPRILADAGNAD